MKQARYLGNFEIAAIVFFAVMVASASVGAQAFAELDSAYRLYLLILWNIIIVVVSGIVFTVGWLVFASDRNWAVTLLATFFLAAGLFNAYYLFNLVSSVGTQAYSMQQLAALSLWARIFTASGLLLTACISVDRTISLAARFALLFVVSAIAFAIFAFTASAYYPDFLSWLFPDSPGAAMRPVVPAVLALTFAVTGFIYLLQRRKRPHLWLRKLLMASFLLALAEVGFLQAGSPASIQSQLAYLLLAVGYTYVYRAVFLYSIQWPIDQMDDWQERLKTSQRELAITKLAVEGSGYYIFEFDEAGNILFVSDNVCSRTGYNRDELIGAEFRILAHRGHRRLFSPGGALDGDRGSPNRLELELRTREGEVFPVATTITYYEDDDHKHCYAIMEDITRQKNFEAQLAENARHLRRVLDSIPFYVTILTPDGKYIGSNNAVFESLEGDDEVSGKSIVDFLAPRVQHEQAETVLNDAIRQAQLGRPTSLELQLKVNDDGPQYVDFVVAPVRDDTGNVVNLVNTSAIITERIVIQNELKLASTVFDHSAEAILITDGNLHTLSANRAFTTITGFEEQDILGETPPLLKEGKHLQDMHASLERKGSWSGEVEWTKRNGDIGYEWLTVTRVFDDDQRVRNYIIIFSDITEKKRTEQHIQYLAYYDPLTGLPNRVLLEDRVNQAIAGARRYRYKVGLVFLDLDHFKTINDSLGHHQGDKLLSEISRRLSAHVREGDTVSRLSGDEFVIVLPGIEDAETAAEVARKLLAEVQLPYLLDGVELRVTMSSGICMYPDDGDNFSRLVMNADAAMYHAKEAGRNNVQVFIGEMSRRAAELLDLETRLRRALDREEFLLHFQPQVSSRDHAIVSFEALVRWNDPGSGMVPPAQFIPVAESRGLITQIDNYVLRAACLQSSAWQAAGLPRLPVAVNVSAKQFRDRNFVNSVRAALEDARLDPRYLELEVTETVIMQDAEEVIATLEALRQLGVKLAIDDFGTGYSSLGYLKRFPIEKIKIDASFVRDIPGDKEDYSIVRAIVGLTQQLNLKVLAEGVETLEQLNALRDIGCDEYQGFYFSEAVSAADFERILRTGSLAGKRRLEVVVN